MVAPLLEVLLLRLLRRRTAAEPPRPTRLVSRTRPVDTLGVVEAGTSVLVQRPGSAPEVLPAGALLWPPLLTGPSATSRPVHVVLTHQPVEVWLRVGPFETLEGRTVHQVELRLTVAVEPSPAGLAELVETEARARGATTAAEPGALDALGERLLDRLAHEVSDRTADAVRRRTLGDLTSLSLAVVLDEALPGSFLSGVLTRSALEVVDVDWPTEGRGWPRTLTPLPGGAGATPSGAGPPR